MFCLQVNIVWLRYLIIFCISLGYIVLFVFQLVLNIYMYYWVIFFSNCQSERLVRKNLLYCFYIIEGKGVRFVGYWLKKNIFFKILKYCKYFLKKNKIYVLVYVQIVCCFDSVRN